MKPFSDVNAALAAPCHDGCIPVLLYAGTARWFRLGEAPDVSDDRITQSVRTRIDNLILLANFSAEKISLGINRGRRTYIAHG